MFNFACCPTVGKFFRGSLLAGAVAAAAFVGTYAAQRQQADAPQFELPPMLMDATASSTSDDFSVATGLLSEDGEGYFVLDHATGLLQCYLLYPRSGQFGGHFSANVREALPGGAGGKGTQYLMVTGIAGFPRSSSSPIGSSAIYVMDANTGEFVVYTVPFNRTMVNSNRPQQGIMTPIARGQARQMPDRDALR